MPKLNQIIALVGGKKTKSAETLTQAYHQLKKPELLSGLIRTYQPRDAEGEPQPEERKMPQVKLAELIQKVYRDLADMLDTTYTQDVANCSAVGSVVVDGRALLPNVPVTYLLYLEKQLVDLRTFVDTLPTLDPSEEWEYRKETDLYVSRPSKTNRTKKVPRNHVKYEATKEHPAQVEVFHEDVMVGTWTTTKFSGCVPASTKNEMLARVGKLIDAVKLAREEANSVSVESKKVGGILLDYVLSGK